MKLATSSGLKAVAARDLIERPVWMYMDPGLQVQFDDLAFWSGAVFCFRALIPERSVDRVRADFSAGLK